MRNEILEFYKQFQITLMWLCGLGLLSIMCIPIFKLFKAGCSELEKFFGKLDRLGKVVCLICGIGLTFVGSTKHYYYNPPQVGADEGIQLWEFNVEYNTNNVPNRTEVTVVWTNNVESITPMSIPQVAFREAASNDWIVVDNMEILDFGQNGISNYFTFAFNNTTNDYSKMKYWWMGNDLPATEIIVTSDDLKITEFEHTSEYVDITIGMSEDLAEIFRNTDEEDQFVIQFSDDDGAHWVDVARTREAYIRIPGFWYGEDRIWRVIFEYSSGDLQVTDTPSNPGEGSDE